MKFNLKSLLFVISFLFSSTTLVLHGYLRYFTRYMADDFCTAYYAQRLGIFRSTWFWYLNWSGRFSASLADATVGLLGPDILPIVVPLSILLWLVTLTLLIHVFLKLPQARWLVSLALASTGLFALFLLTPDIRQSLYWWQGMRSVVPPLILGTAQLTLLNYVLSKLWTRPQLWGWALTGFLLSLLAGGFSETYAACQVAALVIALFLIRIMPQFKRLDLTMLIGSSLFGAICALIIVFLAPGNVERQGFFPAPPSLIGILTISLRGYFSYLMMLIDTPGKVLAMLGVFALAALAGSQRDQEQDPRLLWIIPGLTLGLMFLCFPPAAYGTSDVPPNRTLLLPTYFFLIGILAWGVAVGQFLQEKKADTVLRMLPGLVILSIALSASLHSINLYRSTSEFRSYARWWDETDAHIISTKQQGGSEVVIPVQPGWAALNTPNDNPKFWVNVCMSRYYDVQILA